MLRCTVPVLTELAHAAVLVCNVAEAIARYRQVRDLAPQFSPGDPQVIVPVPAATPQATGTPVASAPVARAEP